MRAFQGKTWIIELLPGWLGEHEEEYALIYHPEGVGALQISAYLKNGPITDADLQDLAQEHIDAGAKLTNVNSGTFNGFTLTFSVDGEFWQCWYVRHDSTAIFITYNCEENNNWQELEQVKSMVATLAPT